ncbi:matrixin family metalloprotease [Flavobacterium jejuense]|uniref:Matrixin family metalloprotease n=1 Tax=Flavobacterium jejuense TaxID=1544455 RepID=A0ABX0IRP4_9FLAO|nr:matrixin family metalloprotease [Flavobacterium jejuense]NHN25750.1 matrixin family metalloprotease [Flavobacterium jejuense]
MNNFFIFLLFVFISCQNRARTETVVGIQPYKGFPKEKTDTLAKTIADFYSVKTVILPAIELPKSAFVQVKSARYRADSIIKIQNRIDLDTIDFILGLTQSDISTTKKDKEGAIKVPKYKYEDWGIMGLAYCPGTSSIVSSFRLQHKNPNIHLTRLKKVTVHELGHNLGLPHCPNKKCVMTDAVESIATIDNAELLLCEKCKKKWN